MRKATPYPATALESGKSQRTFSGSNAVQVAMPLGGIGAGCVCLNGIGGLQDFSIRHEPDTTASPDRHYFRDGAFALLHIKGKNATTRLVEGPYPIEKVYGLGMKSQGNWGGGYEGMPRFGRCTFRGEFPFGFVKLSDPRIPLRVSLTGFNPFIPRDDKNSGIPCAIIEYTLANRSRRRVDYEFSYHLSNLAQKQEFSVMTGGRRGTPGSRNSVIQGAGVFFYNEEHPNSPHFGSASLTVAGHTPVIKAMWFRGGWFDPISVLWREVSTGTFRPNRGSNDNDVDGRNGGSILMAGSLKPGARITYPIVITWYFPNCNLEAGSARDEHDDRGCGSACTSDNPPPKWRPYYASQWKDAKDVASYVRKNYASLRGRTQAFHDALFSSTLPSYVLDAVSANLAIIKSPTVLRQENGNMWAWEGCFCDAGCCYGSCTHVWNYAQAIPHLFPHLERTLREQELERSMDKRGHVQFRSALPDGNPSHSYHAAADGQLGGIMKVYREWQVSGDRKWLERMYPLAKTSINYCIEKWDPRHKGVLEEPHHNTYDIEFWGPDGMCSSIYLGALAAMAEMSCDVGEPGDAAFYEKLAAKGAKFLDTKLFNGEYYEQKVTYKGLRDTSFAESVAKVTKKASDEEQLLKREGPKYQYGSGCLSDGVIGAWMAKMYGINFPQTRSNVRRNLKAIFQYNFKTDLSTHVCTQRPGYAMGREPGLLLCTWPRGGKPTLPFIYSDEVWTGIEYQVASHLIEEGFLKEGLTIVKAARTRYDGRVRNPWCEYECGNYYARAMSSYALLGSLSGFRYSAAKKALWFGPKLDIDEFKVFFSGATGYGMITLSKRSLTIEMVEGELAVDALHLTIGGKTKEVQWRVVAREGDKTVLQNWDIDNS